MKRYLILFFIFFLLASPTFSEDKNPEMMKGAKLSEPQAPKPTIVVGANDLTESTAEPGWPIIVSATLLSEDNLVVASPNNLQIKMVHESGAVVPVHFDAIPSQNNEQTRFWIIPETNLASSNYIVTFEPIEGIVIQPADLAILQPNQGDVAAFNNLKIQKLLLLGKDDEALTEADQQVTSDPENVDAWVAKGDILMGKDMPDEAIQAYQEALDIAEKEEGAEPLFIQERHRAALFRSLEKRGVITEDTQP